MTRFLQIHYLTAYPPSNLNRDDLGRPKTAVMGGRNRLRISSQSLKRAWRTSDVFEQTLDGNVGKRTKQISHYLKPLQDAGKTEKEIAEIRSQILSVFGGSKKGAEDLDTLVYISQSEIKAIESLVQGLCSGKTMPEAKDLQLLKAEAHSVDVSMFGRMFASNTDFNVEAATQVAHAITTHEVAVEDDFFSAVDDLNEGSGSGHLGVHEFGAGLFYGYVCIDLELLKKNVANDDLSKRGVIALIEAIARVSPTGKQNSYASRAHASYMLIEAGNQQPRSLAVAYLKSVKDEADYLESSIVRLESTRNNMDKVYGKGRDSECILNAYKGEGSLDLVKSFVAGVV